LEDSLDAEMAGKLIEKQEVIKKALDRRSHRFSSEEPTESNVRKERNPIGESLLTSLGEEPIV